MNRLHLACITVAICLLSPLCLRAQHLICDTINVKACIEGQSRLHVQGNRLWWEHISFSPPGTGVNCPLVNPVTVDGVVWTNWQDDFFIVDGVKCQSLTSFDAIQCRDACFISQQPDASNGWELIFTFNDGPQANADMYEINLAFCGVRPQSLVISSNSPACEGELLNISVPNVSGATYEWSGPNGFTSSSPNISIPDITLTHAGTYSVTASDSCFFLTGALNFVVNPTPLVDYSIVNPQCNTATGSVTLAPEVAGSPYRYDWVSGTQPPTVSGLVAGIYYVTTTDNNTGCFIIDTILLEDIGLIETSAIGTDVACPDGIDGTTQLSVLGGVGPYTYIWSNNMVDEDLTGLSMGEYYVTVTDANGCEGFDTVMVSEPPPLALNAVVNDVSCYKLTDGSVDLTVTGGSPGYTYQWSVPAYSEDIIAIGAGTITVTVTDTRGCTVDDTYTINEPDSIWVEIQMDTATEYPYGVQNMQAIYPSGVPSPSFQWFPFTGLDCYTCDQVFPSPDSGMFYSLTLTDVNGCTANSVAFVEVYDNSYIYIPNAFSPNADGVNDVFNIYISAAETVQIKIFDRWGEMVFNTNSIEFGWDGTHRGAIMDPAVFVYHIEIGFSGNRFIRREGSITLLR